ncbi:hypothetical protein HDV00_006613 [Rhizophlyctis rosea]|nr:hypothetical protein HDV00_006613 [Rhizophlyctis rosea]
MPIVDPTFALSICSFCTLDSLATLALVSKRWNAIAISDAAWKAVTLRILQEDIPWADSGLTPLKVSECQEAFRAMYGGVGGWREFCLLQIKPLLDSHQAAVKALEETEEWGEEPLPPLEGIRFKAEIAFDLELLPPDVELPPEASRVFGRPWMPESLYEQILQEDETRYFVAQLNCKDSHAFLPAVSASLPAEGIIYIFSTRAEGPNLGVHAADNTIVYYPGPFSALRRIPLQSPCICQAPDRRRASDSPPCYKGVWPSEPRWGRDDENCSVSFGDKVPIPVCEREWVPLPYLRATHEHEHRCAYIDPSEPAPPFISMFGFLQIPREESIGEDVCLLPTVSHSQSRHITADTDDEDYDEALEKFTNGVRKEGTVLFQMARMVGAGGADCGSFVRVWAYQGLETLEGRWNDVGLAEYQYLWAHVTYGL